MLSPYSKDFERFRDQRRLAPYARLWRPASEKICFPSPSRDLMSSGTSKTANRKTGSCRWHFGRRFSDLRDSHRPIFRAIQPVVLLCERSAARPSGFIEPCRRSRAPRPPSGPDRVHEIKHDGLPAHGAPERLAGGPVHARRGRRLATSRSNSANRVWRL